MLPINHHEVIAAQLAGLYCEQYNASRAHEGTVEVVSNPVYQGINLIGGATIYYVPLFKTSENVSRAADLIIQLADGECVGCDLR